MFSSKTPCPRCSRKLKDSFDFCPYCGIDIRDPEREMQDFGILGKNEMTNSPVVGGGSFGITDKVINSLINSFMKSIEKQMKQADEDSSVEHYPNGVTIRVGEPSGSKPAKKSRPTITQKHIDRMKGLPRVEAKTSIKRLGDKVVYELKAPGVISVDDVFVSKLASGYEVKAIGKNKVYVNSLPVELPLKSYAVEKEGLFLEFGAQ